MEKWRCIGWTGIILGIGVQILDYFVENIPFGIMIPIEIVAIVMIFTGLIIRKREKNQEQ